MDPYLNLNNSGATNLTLGKNDVQEATVVTNAYSGQYGQQAGAQVSYVTKSGTNQFHGNAEYWWTGRAMDANDYFNNLSGTPRPFANNNQWAASLGGPIKKDKLFFFVDTEGIRYIVPSSHDGVFSDRGICQRDAGEPGGDRSGFGAAVFEDVQPVPIGSGLQPRSWRTGKLPGSDDLRGKLLPVSTERRLRCRARSGSSADALTTTCPTATTCSGGYRWTTARRRRMPIRSTRRSTRPASSLRTMDRDSGRTRFGSNATNQFIYAGSYYRAIFTQTARCQLGVPNAGLTWLRWATPTWAAIWSSFPQGRNVTQYQFLDDFSWTKGAHSLKFGGNFRRYDITDYTFGTFTNPLLRHHFGHRFLQRRGGRVRAELPLARYRAGGPVGTRCVCSG